MQCWPERKNIFMAYILDQFSLFATACFVKCVDLKKKNKKRLLLCMTLNIKNALSTSVPLLSACFFFF